MMSPVTFATIVHETPFNSKPVETAFTPFNVTVYSPFVIRDVVVTVKTPSAYVGVISTVSPEESFITTVCLVTVDGTSASETLNETLFVDVLYSSFSSKVTSAGIYAFKLAMSIATSDQVGSLYALTKIAPDGTNPLSTVWSVPSPVYDKTFCPSTISYKSIDQLSVVFALYHTAFMLTKPSVSFVNVLFHVGNNPPDQTSSPVE